MLGARALSSGARPAARLFTAMTEEQKRVRLAGVRAEREVYVMRGLVDRVAACDAEIARLKGEPPAHQSRASRRPRPEFGREAR